MILIEKTELKELIREVIREELLNLSISLTPYVSDAEMKEIESVYNDDDFSNSDMVDMTSWLGR